MTGHDRRYELITINIRPELVHIQTKHRFYSTVYLNYVSISYRHTFFKFLHNTLNLNCRLSHFKLDVERGCHFCTIAKSRHIEDETYTHIFILCPNLQQIRTSMTELLNFTNFSISEILTGSTADSRDNYEFANLIILMYINFIMSYKLSSSIPTWRSFLSSVTFTIRTAMTVSKGFSNRMGFLIKKNPHLSFLE